MDAKTAPQGVVIASDFAPHREVVENYAVDYPEPVAGWFNIGVLHTACGCTGHENYAPCTAADLSQRAGMTIGRSATFTPSKSSRGIHGSYIPAISRAAVSENAEQEARSLCRSQTGLSRRFGAL